MSIVCPRCGRVLEYGEEPPLFCAYCGQRLPTAAPRPYSATGEYLGAGAGGGAGEETADFPGTATDAPGGEGAELRTGQVGGYRIKRLIGTGGMGSVYEAEAAGTGQRVAVKLLSSQFTTNPVSVERFRLEGKLASQITHPRCVFVYAADTDQGRPYIVMELMPGTTLKDLVERRGPLPPQEAVGLILDVIDGLREAHRHGVIHRDVKPSNCFLMPDGRVKIGDFGLSKSLTADANLTQSGAFLGTVLYASPEQIRGQDVEYASDVYSVCATLYHLLTGRAPFEHESVTAALARIISEDPPHVRSLRPEVPRSLARVVHTGLHRDKARRFQNLDELRHALVALVPAHLSFGGLWVRAGAILIDLFFVQFFLVRPLGGLLGRLFEGVSFFPYLSLVVLPLYFVLLEGLAGASLGKRLLGLRVCRVGSTDPPGLRRAAVRTLIFFLLVIVTLVLPRLGVERLLEEGLTWNLLREAIPLAVGLGLLTWPMRRRNDYRGLHEWASGTCVMQLPHRRRPLRLRGRGASRLESLLPRPADFPGYIGPYEVRAASPAAPGGERVVLGEDPVLGRKVLLWLWPADRPVVEGRRAEVGRPGRPRLLGRGTVRVGERELTWQAFVAPVGSPLTDVVNPARPLHWPVARLLLEQLADELAAAEAEATVPASLTVEQVWVEPTGQVHLLDFPVPSPGSPPPEVPEPPGRAPGPGVGREADARRCLRLLAEAAALTLEGRARGPDAQAPAPGGIAAPLPRHAARVLGRLFDTRRGYASAAEFRDELYRTREHPARLTGWARLGQIGVQAALLSLGLVLMFFASGTFAVNDLLDRRDAVRHADRALAALRSPERLAELRQDTAVAAHLGDPESLAARIAARRKDDLLRAEHLEGGLSAAERFLFDQTEPALAEVAHASLPSESVQLAARRVAAGDAADLWLPSLAPVLPGHWEQALFLVLVWPPLWAAGAYVLRGGLSFWLCGIAVVRSDGSDASRRRCAGRAFLVWAPVALLLSVSVVVREFWPSAAGLHAGLWWAALLLLPAYVAAAVLSPNRPPQDRLLGTHLVPR